MILLPTFGHIKRRYQYSTDFFFFQQYVDIGIQGNEDNVKVIDVDAGKHLRQLRSVMGPLGVIKVVIKQNT